MDEQKLITAAQRGDVRAFNQLVRAHQTGVYRTALRVLGEPEAAADATQDAFILAFKNLDAFRGGSMKSWLVRIATNSCYDQLRARRRKPATSLDALLEDPSYAGLRLGPSHLESPQEYAERQELRTMIEKGLQTLPVDQRVTLVLADIEGFTYAEIAEITETNIGTVKSRLARGRSLLRTFLLANAEIEPAPQPLPTLAYSAA